MNQLTIHLQLVTDVIIGISHDYAKKTFELQYIVLNKKFTLINIRAIFLDEIRVI